MKKKTVVRAKLKIESFDNVFDAVEDSPAVAANLKARADLILQIERIIAKNKWTQSEAAEQCGISIPRVNSLLKGHIDLFSLDALVNIAAALGRRVEVTLAA